MNGQPIKGEILAVRPEGIELAAAGGSKLYPWPAFSPATRFRYDPLYRANLALAQQGLPSRSWTNAADGGYVASPTPPAPETAAASGAAIEPLAFSGFPALPAQPRAGLAGLDLRNAPRALTWGFRYGPGPNDAIYCVIDPAGDDGLPHTLWVWSQPGKRPEALRGSRRSDGDETSVSFRKQRVQSQRDGASVQFDLALSASTREPGALAVSLDVELKQGSVLSSFTLVGIPPGVLTGDGNVVARDLLAGPALKLGVELLDGKPVLAGNIRMGRLVLIPRAGMQKGVSVEIRDARQAKVLDELLPIKEDTARSRSSLLLPLDRLAAGQKYSLRASVDLGPFLGVLRYEESFVRP